MSVSLQQMCCDHVNYDINVRCWLCLSEVLVSSAKADLTLQDAHRNTALHLACSKVPNTRSHTSNTSSTVHQSSPAARHTTGTQTQACKEHKTVPPARWMKEPRFQ